MFETTARQRLLRFARASAEAAVLALAFVTAFAFRFDGAPPDDRVTQLLLMLAPVVALQMLALRALGAHRQSWRYTTLEDLVDVALAILSVTLLLVVVRMVPNTPSDVSLPYGVTLADGAAAFLGVGGLRVLRRLQSERQEAVRRERGEQRERVVLIGAGRAGVMVAKEISRRPEMGLVPVGFVDDDPAKQGRRIAGLEVLGTTDDLARIATDARVAEAIVTMASVNRSDINRIIRGCRDAELPTRIIPGLFEIVGGTINLSRIRPVQVEDLLGREPVDLDPTSLHGLLGGRTVMVTGAGGSIGAELARQAARFDPRALVLVDRAEPALWRVHRQLSFASTAGVAVHACLADVRDEPRMRRLFAEYSPDVVIHAAAHKHVPLMEEHPGEAVKNNVGGTRIVVDLSVEAEVDQFVLVSTDKAVNPTSVMGATKRLAERYVQHVANATGLNLVAVRFGNVLGSAGSVVPIFEEQVRKGGPVTVTHPDMVRYFMTIPEASGLVLQAAALGQPGEILVLDMGEPVRIVDLAESVIRLSGFEPGRDIQVEFTGLRPGEKLFEELSLTDEHATRTRHPKVWIGQIDEPTWDTVDGDLAALLAAADRLGPDELRGLLAWCVPEFTGTSEPIESEVAEPEPVESEPGEPEPGEAGEPEPGGPEATDAPSAPPTSPTLGMPTR